MISDIKLSVVAVGAVAMAVVVGGRAGPIDKVDAHQKKRNWPMPEGAADRILPRPPPLLRPTISVSGGRHGQRPERIQRRREINATAGRLLLTFHR